MIRAIVFDFDGVLADTERLHLGAFQQVFAARGWSLDEETYFERYLGCDDEGLVQAYSSDERLSLARGDVDALVRAKTDAFSHHLSSSDILFPGARRAVELLGQHFALGIASGALHAEIDAILTTGGIRDAFQTVVGADDVLTSKPSPEPYLTAAARLGVDPGMCVAVEDSAAGLQAAIAAGMKTIAVTTTSSPQALSRADRILSGVHELSFEIITALGTIQGL